MLYEEAINYIHNTHKFGMKLGLNNIKILLDYMGNPQDSLKIIHVAGTNGKGSTCSFINSILMSSGYNVGLYTSPYLEEFEERIRINNKNIPKDVLANYVEYIKDLINKMESNGYNHPTEFEIITAIAFKYFSDSNVDFVVLEVGLGGRFDATNVIKNPLVSVITTIDFDHMDKLGNTIEKIAFEKAGIIKENGVVVSSFQRDGAMKVIEDTCKSRNATLFVLNRDDILVKESNDEYQRFDYGNYKDMIIRLLGKHQIYNAILAIITMVQLQRYDIYIDKKDIQKGLESTRWPGRLEVMNRSPLIVIDGAHNTQGMRVLRDSLSLFRYSKLILVIGILKDKESKKMLDLILPFADFVITSMPISERAYTALELSQKIDKPNVLHFESIDDAINHAIKISKDDDMILFCGSLYMIGHVRTTLRKVILPSLK